MQFVKCRPRNAWYSTKHSLDRNKNTSYILFIIIVCGDGTLLLCSKHALVQNINNETTFILAYMYMYYMDEYFEMDWLNVLHVYSYLSSSL